MSCSRRGRKFDQPRILTALQDRAKILIVEDEQAIREMIAFALTREGFVVTEAENARDGLEMVVSEQPDLGVIDWMLPDMSGICLLYTSDAADE